jgi:hypothetical protein
MEVHVSLVGRMDLTGEIYRQLRRAILEGGSHRAVGCPRPGSWPAG